MPIPIIKFIIRVEDGPNTSFKLHYKIAKDDPYIPHKPKVIQ